MSRNHIVITGASDGIGKAVALEFLKDEETNLFLISRNEKKLKEILTEINDDRGRITIFPFDLSSGNYQTLGTAVREKFSKVDILINNAATLINKPFEEITVNDFDAVISTNYKAPFFLIQELLSHFSGNAHIVNIGSMGGYQGSAKFPGLSLYSSSKGALSILTESLALELSPLGISLNCLALGSVQTSMFEEAFPGLMSNMTSESIAQYVAWFAKNGYQWMNGKVIPVSISTP